MSGHWQIVSHWKHGDMGSEPGSIIWVGGADDITRWSVDLTPPPLIAPNPSNSLPKYSSEITRGTQWLGIQKDKIIIKRFWLIFKDEPKLFCNIFYFHFHFRSYEPIIPLCWTHFKSSTKNPPKKKKKWQVLRKNGQLTRLLEILQMSLIVWTSLHTMQKKKIWIRLVSCCFLRNNDKILYYRSHVSHRTG